jgi:beta-glucosidase
MPLLPFPPNFYWGSATSSYQIEGAWNEDGKGESIWDRFSHTPGRILNNENGDTACDHYHLWNSDVAMLRDLGLKAYRFSISWPRVLPFGTSSTINEKGLSFYDQLVDALLEANITPFVTLYHWDLPQALQDKGGWPNRDTAYNFLDYTDVVTRKLGDRVKHWTTHNEPAVSSLTGHQSGRHAPGFTDWGLGLAAAHHILLSHGLAVPTIRANVPGSQVGMVIDSIPSEPASADPADYATFRWYDGFHNRWFLDPLYGRQYPADIVTEHIQRGHLSPAGLTFLHDGDYDLIASPTDYLGLNYYRRAVLNSASPDSIATPRATDAPEEGWTEMGWEIYADGLFNLIMQTHLTYRPPAIYIAENGASYQDGPGPDGKIHDTRRINYLRQHIAATQKAIQAGAPVKGYMLWSLMDNFEWAFGYSQRFGMVWVDPQTQQRIPKDSAWWYKGVIEANAVEIE